MFFGEGVAIFFESIPNFKKISIFFRIFFVYILLSSATLKAGVYIKQRVDTKIDGKTFQSYQEWYLDQGKFKFKTSSAQSSTEYFFSGTVMYVCGKLNADQVKQLKARSQVKNVEHFADKVTCQVVPHNFLVRFFLSPNASVESVDSSDGLKLTLSLTEYSLKPSTLSQAVPRGSCDPWKRSFKLKKTRSDFNGQDTHIIGTVRESLCVDKKLEWRKFLWREVMKAVLVQPGGAGILQDLRKDYQSLVGLNLQGEVDQTIEVSGQSPRRITTTVSLVSHSVQTIAQKELRLPDDVQMFHPESYAYQEESNSKGKKEPMPTNGKQDISIVDFLQSAVFCGLARGICIH